MTPETGLRNPLSPIGIPRVLYQDPRCLVVNKFPGEAVEGAAPGMIDLPRLLKETCGGADPGQGGLAVPIAVNRLDVPASGCALFARTRQALSRLNAALGEGKMEKHYWAIVENSSPREFSESGEWIHWLSRNSRTNKSRAWAEEGPGRKKRILRYRINGLAVCCASRINRIKIRESEFLYHANC